MWGFNETQQVNETRTVVLDDNGRVDPLGTLARFGTNADRIATANALLEAGRALVAQGKALSAAGVSNDASNGFRHEADALAGKAFWLAIESDALAVYEGETWEIAGGSSTDIDLVRGRVVVDALPSDVEKYVAKS